MTSAAARTIAELRSSGHVRESVKQEMRRNLLARLRSGEPLLPGIVGYDDTVLPQLANAVISGHDVIMLGERGQAKSRIMRSLINFLDPQVPAIAGCEINDHPFAPICRRCLDLVAKSGDKVEVTWIDRDQRYGEKLATPDISIADLIGEVHPIMEAERHPIPEDFELIFPSFMKEIVAELTHLARRSPHISQSSGVSVRMSIANFENLASNSVRRAARLGESLAVPRITDLAYLTSSTAGRVEIEALDEGKEEQVLSRLERGAISAVFSRHFSAAQFDGVVARFEDGAMLEVGEGIPARTYTRAIGELPEVATALKKLSLPDRPEVRASVIEFLLEGLHLNKRLNKDEVEGRAVYRR